MIFNVLGLPVTQVPLGLSKSGLPIGLQIVSGPFNDHLSIGVAEELEKTFGGWVPPCHYLTA
jgi:fatty acid amide hydrolase 2